MNTAARTLLTLFNPLWRELLACVRAEHAGGIVPLNPLGCASLAVELFEKSCRYPLRNREFYVNACILAYPAARQLVTGRASRLRNIGFGYLAAGL